ncbi:MAG: hypothetical protein A2Y17_11370 [Clostridiales bacterium GWF2_38_85]|nr:MAG: hypothetical protein A2Y17_11370 [Clostridiales bacterium GWF2_38_85]HBL84725.1 hypothetical protein [Clostridiales bacterium]
MYNYSICCGKEIRATIRKFPKIHYCKDCKALHVYWLSKKGFKISTWFLGDRMICGMATVKSDK